MSGIHEEHEKSNISSKRLVIVLLIQLFLFFVLICRLYFLQIVGYKKYKELSEDNRIKNFIIPPLRGHILDRNGIKLTENEKSYRVLLYQDKTDNRDVISKLSKILELSPEDYQKILKKLEKNKDLPIVSILDNVSWNNLEKIETNSYMLNGIMIEDGYMRYYPYSTTFSHILGYVNNPTKEEIDNENNVKTKDLLLHPDYKIGRTGLEKLFDKEIMGNIGYKKLEMNALSMPIREIETKNSTEGKDLELTIDYNLQSFVEETMGNTDGAVIVMNVRTGEILSMVSKPAFDSNKFIEGVSNDYWNELNNNPANPLTNKAVSATYPPGSTFKLMTAIAGLENGWTEDKKVTCTGQLVLNKKRTLHCWKKEGHGTINLVQAIQHSCNIYFTKVGLATGIDNIYNIAKEFGFGEDFDIELFNLKKGLVPNKDWKKKIFNDVWVTGDTVNVAIGQGFLTATPLELVVMVSRIANGGYKIKPFLVKNNPAAQHNLSLFDENPMVSENTIDTVKKGMYNVVNVEGGTAYGSRIKEHGFEMCGKTGTAQVIAKDKKDILEEENEEIDNKFKNHGLFVAFAPCDNPKYAIVVIAEHGGGGAAAAAPIARDVLYYAEKNNIGFDIIKDIEDKDTTIKK